MDDWRTWCEAGCAFIVKCMYALHAGHSGFGCQGSRIHRLGQCVMHHLAPRVEGLFGNRMSLI